MSDNKILEAVSDGGLKIYTVDAATVGAELDGTNVSAGTLATVAGFDSSGAPVKTSYLSARLCMTVFINGIPSVAAGGSYDILLPFTGAGAAVTVTGVTVNAGIYTGLTGDTIIEVSNDTAGGAGDKIDVTLTNSGATTDHVATATGTVTIDPTSGDEIYIYLTQSGDHGDLNITLWGNIV